MSKEAYLTKKKIQINIPNQRCVDFPSGGCWNTAAFLFFFFFRFFFFWTSSYLTSKGEVVSPRRHEAAEVFMSSPQRVVLVLLAVSGSIWLAKVFLFPCPPASCPSPVESSLAASPLSTTYAGLESKFGKYDIQLSALWENISHPDTGRASAYLTCPALDAALDTTVAVLRRHPRSHGEEACLVARSCVESHEAESECVLA
jgi:hypothetical protein